MAEITLNDFPATRAVLNDLAADIKDGYIDKLTLDDHIASGDLADTMVAKVIEGDMEFTVALDMLPYWKYLEEGTRPHWPPRGAILRWIEVKPVIPRPGPDGRIPSPQQLAYLIQRKIGEEGTEATHSLEKTKDAILPFYKEQIRKAVMEDSRNMVERIIHSLGSVSIT